MSSEKLIKEIRKDLLKLASFRDKQSFKRFFKNEVKCYGLKSSKVGIVFKKYWPKISELSKKEFYLLCEKLLSSDYCEEAFLVSSWLPYFTDKFKQSDIKIFEKWIDKYINNWAKCDGFCNHSVGNLIEKYPNLISDLKKWSKSKNIWLKRASAVSLIIPAKNGKYLKDVFEISTTLLCDENDMVQKGYGWLLKEASRKNEKEVFNFVIKNKKQMPRTSLRYAIELMPKNLKVLAMDKADL